MDEPHSLYLLGCASVLVLGTEGEAPSGRTTLVTLLGVYTRVRALGTGVDALSGRTTLDAFKDVYTQVRAWGTGVDALSGRTTLVALAFLPPV